MPTVNAADERSIQAAVPSDLAPGARRAAPLPAPLAALEAVYRELDTSYRELQDQVLGLRTELALSDRARLRELEEKECLFERLSALLAVLPGGVLLLDAGDTIRDVNPAAVELLGQPLIGAPWRDVAERNPELGGEAGGGRQFAVQRRALAGHGEAVVLITDTTEKHELQRQLERKHRLAAVGEMLARLAHQIRTPLASTTLYLAQLARADLEPAKRGRIARRLGEGLGHMEGLIESTLSFVRGKRPEQTLVTLREVLDTLQANVRPGLPDHVDLRVTPVDDTLCLRACADDLAGALGNLVKNASELDRRPIHIDIWAGAVSARWLQVRVRDDGPGIAEAHLGRLFDPFFTTRAGGTGLGLAVVAMTVDHCGGRVRVNNRAGGGAEFLLDLPLVDPAVADPAVADPAVADPAVADPAVAGDKRPESTPG